MRYQTKAVCEHVVNLHLIVGQSGTIFHSKFSGYFHPFILETCCLQSSLQLLNNMRTSITALHEDVYSTFFDASQTCQTEELVMKEIFLFHIKRSNIVLTRFISKPSAETSVNIFASF